MRSIIMSVAAVTLLAGCATSENNVEPLREKEVVTGSNIPRRDRSNTGVGVISREELQRMQDSGGGSRSTNPPR